MVNKVSDEEKPYLVVAKLINLILSLVDGLLLFRFLFKLVGANTVSEFVRWLYEVTDVLMAPFELIIPTNATQGVVLEWSVLVAMVVYAFIAQLIIRVVSIVYTADSGGDVDGSIEE